MTKSSAAMIASRRWARFAIRSLSAFRDMPASSGVSRIILRPSNSNTGLSLSAGFPPEHFGFAQRNDNPGCQGVEQVRLDIEQVRDARAGGGIGVAIDVELRHQKERRPSLNTPCFSTCSL